ncbi:MAG: hypothetical protein ACYDHE_21090 [Candidatus Acidiferrales bacterium]
MMTSNYPEEKPKRVSWVSQAYQRVPWLRVRYGRTVKPQMEQASNLHLDDAQVMQRRDEPVMHSFAFPLGVGGDSAGEETYAKQ